METDAEKINDPDRKKRELIWREAEGYAETRDQSRKLNKTRAKSRSNIADGGIRTDAFQDGIRLVKDLEPGDLEQYLADLQLVLDVLGARQGDLFPEEVAKREKAKQDAAKKAAAAATKGTPKNASGKAAAAAESKGKGNVTQLNRAPLSSEQNAAEQNEGADALSRKPH